MLGLLFDGDEIMFYTHNVDFLIWEVTLTVRGRVHVTQWTSFIIYPLAGPSYGACPERKDTSRVGR